MHLLEGRYADVDYDLPRKVQTRRALPLEPGGYASHTSIAVLCTSGVLANIHRNLRVPSHVLQSLKKLVYPHNDCL